MPPITLSSGGSDSGSGSEDVIPGERSTTQNAEMDGGSKETVQDDAEADEDDEGEEEELYVVEEILDHQFEDDALLYKIKWEGYDKKSDQTWESEDKLEGATEALKEYHEKIGGKPIQRKVTTPSSSSHKRPRTDSKPATPTTAAKNSKVRRLNESARADSPATDNLSRWVPPKGSWEEDVMQVDTIERDDQGLHVYLDWNNGKKTRHAIEKIYNKCPKKMLRFYEQHLVFKEGDASVSGAVSGNGILSNGR